MNTAQQIRFGIELEVCNLDHLALYTLMEESGIGLESHHHSLVSSCARPWALHHDGSVTQDSCDNLWKGELVSPDGGIPYGAAGMSQLVLVLDLLNRPSVKARSNQSCGFHLHISMGGSAPSILAEWAWNNKDWFFERVPDHRRHNRYVNWAKGVGGHYQCFNPYTSHGTMEIRCHPGTTNPLEVVMWVNLWGSVLFTMAHGAVNEYDSVTTSVQPHLLAYYRDKIGETESIVRTRTAEPETPVVTLRPDEREMLYNYLCDLPSEALRSYVRAELVGQHNNPTFGTFLHLKTDTFRALQIHPETFRRELTKAFDDFDLGVALVANKLFTQFRRRNFPDGKLKVIHDTIFDWVYEHAV